MRIWARFSLGLLLLTLTASSAAGAEAKRVLMVHSFGSTAPPFTTGSTAFAATLAEEMGRHVDVDEVSLDMARYAQPDMEEPFVEFLLKRLTRWQPDLVVPIGSPAGRFVAKYREQLFPRTPIIYAGMDRRTLPPEALRTNATFVGEQYDLAGVVEDILELAPDTTHIAVVMGASPLERYWTSELRRAVERFTNRVSFIWLDDLSFDEMLDRVAALPAHSFILLGLLVRDATGVTHNQDEALQRLHAVANAPINGVFQNQLGLGIVGGRLYQPEAMGVETARIAIRILRGEPVSNFPPRIVGPQRPRYDWRELQRWNISEERLPRGSAIAFRQPTVWKRYRWWILGILSIALLEGALIVQLAMNLVKRRHAESSLRESEERVNLAADSSGAGLWSLDLNTRRVWATPRLRELFQFSPDEELNYESFLKVVHPHDRERVRHSFEQALPEEGPGLGVEFQFRILRTDGSQRWIATRGQHDSRRRNGATRWTGASLDITERKLAEVRLRESESRFRIIADCAPILIWISGVDKSCTFFNKPWLDFTGRTLEQEVGHGWTEGVHPDDLPGCLKVYGECFDTREAFVLQYRLRRHDGEFRWVCDNGVPRYDEHGNFVGYIGSCSDITERVQAEEKFRRVFEGAPNAMIMVSADGKIALVNAQVEKIFGYQREELIGRSIETLIPERFRDMHPEHRKQFGADPRARSMGAGRDLFGRRKDGSEVPIEIGLNPIRIVEGLFVVASVIDITERRTAQAEAQGLRQELVHISRVATIGELTAAIVHQLGQPLQAILSNAQVGLRFMASGSEGTNELHGILEDIVTDDQRAGQVIQHLRSLLKKGEVERRPLLLNDLVNEAVSVVRSDAERRQVSIILDLAPRLPLVSADRVQLQQVLLNLLVNAFEAMAEVTTRARRIILRTRALGEDRVQVDVTDTGPGITSEILDSIFRPFVTSKSGGMGMGLSVSDSIMRAHAGGLWAENSLEGGATFHMVLPAIPEEQQSKDDISDGMSAVDRAIPIKGGSGKHPLPIASSVSSLLGDQRGGCADALGLSPDSGGALQG